MATVAGFFVKIGASTRDFDRAVGGVRRSLRGLDDETRKAVKGIGADFATEAAKSKEALARGLIDERQFAARGQAAAQAFNASIMAEIDRLRSSGNLTGAALGTLVNQLRTVESASDRAAQSMRQLGDTATKAGRTLSVAVTAPVVALGAASLHVAGSFEAAMNRVEAVSGAAGKEIAALSAQAKKLGETTQFSASQAADAMGFLAMAGFEADQILGAMPSTLQLAAAAQIDLGRAADITSNILTGYGLTVAELGHANDVLVRAFTRTNTDLSMLGESFKYVGPLARAAGVEFEEAAAAIGLMGNAGIQGSMAGTSLRGAVTRLLRPTGEVSRTLNRLGVQVRGAGGELRSLAGILAELEAAGASADDMMALFGHRGGPAMQALLDQGSDAMRRLTADLAAAGGTAQRVADAQMKGFRGALRELKSAVEGLAIALSDSGLIQAMTGLAKSAAELVRAVGRSSPGLLRWAVAIVAIAAVAGPAALVVGKLSITIAALSASLTGGLLPLIVAGGPLVLALGWVSALFLKVKMDAAAAASSVEDFEGAAAGVAGAPAAQMRTIQQLEERRAWLVRHTGSLRRSLAAAEAAGSKRLAESLRRDVERYTAEFRAVMSDIDSLRAAAREVAGEDAAEVVAPIRELRTQLDLTTDNFQRLVAAERQALDALADLRFEQALAPAGDALDQVNRKLEETAAHLETIRREMARFPADASRIAAPVVAAQQSIGPARLAPRLQRIAPPPALFDKVQAEVRSLIERGIPVEALAAEQVEGFRRIIAQREKLEQEYAEAFGQQQKSAFDMLKEGDLLGAAKAAFGPLLKIAAPLAVAFEFLRGVMASLGEPLKALLLPIKLVGEAFGKALLPVIKALYPVIRFLAVAVTYSAESILTVAGWLMKAIGWVITGLGKVVKWITFGIVKQLEQAGQGMVGFGDDLLGGARDMKDARDELRGLSFEDALARVTDGANRAADALLNVPQGFKVALARFRATTPVVSQASVPSAAAAPAGSTVTHSVTIEHVEIRAAQGVDVGQLWRDLQREIQRQAQRGGAQLVFAE